MTSSNSVQLSSENRVSGAGLSMQGVRARTRRYHLEQGKFRFVGFSPNLGLECYLAESALLSGSLPPASRTLCSAAHRLLRQAQSYRGHLFWNWEKTPSIAGEYFPLDWDDTSKALDFLRPWLDGALERSPGSTRLRRISHLLPSDELWEDELLKGIHEHPPKRSHRTEFPRLSVFFGSDTPAPQRHDSMVTVVTVRTTANLFPAVFAKHRSLMLSLLRGVGRTVMDVLSGQRRFAEASRYYLSLGHLLFRLTETLQRLSLDLKSVGVDKTSFLEWLHEPAALLEHLPLNMGAEEARWASMIDFMLDENRSCVPENLAALRCRIPKFSMVYRHRRLDHYYTATDWLERLHAWELKRLVSAKSSLEPFKMIGGE